MYIIIEELNQFTMEERSAELCGMLLDKYSEHENLTKKEIFELYKMVISATGLK